MHSRPWSSALVVYNGTLWHEAQITRVQAAPPLRRCSAGSDLPETSSGEAPAERPVQETASSLLPRSAGPTACTRSNQNSWPGSTSPFITLFPLV